MRFSGRANPLDGVSVGLTFGAECEIGASRSERTREGDVRHAEEIPKARKSDSPGNQWSVQGDRASYSPQATFEVILLAQYFRLDWAKLGVRFKGFVAARLLFQILLDWTEPEMGFANKPVTSERRAIEVLWT